MHKYPVFRDAEKYLRTREPNRWKTRIKQRLEQRALRKCLGGLPLRDGVLDIPCGPGRLFPFWSTLGIPVYAADYSEEFVAHAKELHGKLIGEGWVTQGDAFQVSSLTELQDGILPSLIASVRFIYYFTPHRRARLLKSLSLVGAPFLLTQYIIKDSWRSRRKRFLAWLFRTRKSDGVRVHLRKRRVTREQMLAELAKAGIDVLRVVPAGPLSDRFYVIGRFRGSVALLA